MKQVLRFHLYALSLLLLIGFSSCKKNTDNDNDGGGPGDGQYYLRFNANGVKKEFTGFTIVDFAEIQGVYNYAFQGRNSHADLRGMTISIYTPAVLTQPASFTYQNFAPLNVPQTHMGYMTEDRTMFVSMTTLFPDYVANISVTEITPDYMKGTFSGKLTNEDWTASITITNGEFKLKKAR